MVFVDSIRAIRQFQRGMLGLGAISGAGWALLPNPHARWFGVVSVVSGLLTGLGAERLAFLQAAPRRITATRRQTFLESLGTGGMGSLGLRACASDQEAVNLSAQVAQLLRDAGCEVHDGLTVGNPTPEGIAIGVIAPDPAKTERAQRLIAAFTAAGFRTDPVITTQIGGSLQGSVVVLIGPKPTGALREPRG